MARKRPFNRACLGLLTDSAVAQVSPADRPRNRLRGGVMGLLAVLRRYGTRLPNVRPRRRSAAVGCLAVVAAAFSAVAPSALAPPPPAASVPRLSHVFVIMEENNGFHDIIGNPAAPNINYLARTFGL